MSLVVAQLLPFGVLGAFVGPLVDRLSPRVLLVGADLVRVALVLAMIPSYALAWLLLTVLILEGIGKAVFETARITAIPLIVRRHSIPTAVGLFQTTIQTLNLVGPVVGGLLIAAVNVRGLRRRRRDVRRVRGAARQHGGAAGRHGDRQRPEVSTGSRCAPASPACSAVPSLRFLAIVMVPVMVALGLFTTNLNSQLLISFDLSAWAFGLGQAMLGGGAILGAIFGPVLVKRYSLTGLLGGAVALFAASLLVLWPISASWPAGGVIVVAAWCALVGLGMSLVQVPVANILLRDLPAELRGRGIALLNALMINFMLVGVVLGGVVATWIGVAASIIVTGAVLVIPALVLILRVRQAPRPAAEVDAPA